MKVLSFEHACAIMGYDRDFCLPNVAMCPPVNRKAIIAAAKLFIISAASWKGEDKKIDWNDTNQIKWFVWAYLNKPGFRFGVSAYAFFTSYSAGGSRLCFPSEEDAEYHFEKFKPLFKQLMVI